MPAHRIVFLRLSRNGLVARGQSRVTLLPGIIMLAVATRAWLLFGRDFVPGVNGAYYLVRARSLMDRDVLGIPDLPPTFHLHATLAWLLVKVGGIGLADAILLRAMKLCDAVLPSLTGITYGAQSNPNLLGEWQSVIDNGSGSRHIFNVPVADNPQIFMRLKVTSP